MSKGSRIVLLLVIFVFVTHLERAKSSVINATSHEEEAEDEDADAAFENMNLAEFKERYRRLIPYMTYYVANNYVNSQVSGPSSAQRTNDRDRMVSATSPLMRKPQRLVPIIETNSDPRRRPIGHAGTNIGKIVGHNKHESKFVPSVQYDPKDTSVDGDYFTPVRYNPKLNYEAMEYSDSSLSNRFREYDRPRQRPIVRPEVKNPLAETPHHDERYQLNARPNLRPYNSAYETRFLPRKTKVQVIDDFHQDYPQDYGQQTFVNRGTNDNVDYGYTADNYEPVRYVERPTRPQPKPTRILAQTPLLRPQKIGYSIYPTGNPPTASLDDVIKSLRLTDRLPEMLNPDNIDSSIRTLVEILGILNNAKQTDYQRTTVAPLPPRNLPNYPNYKQIYTRPKVITETRFQATPSPLVVADQRESFDYKNEEAYGPNIGSNENINGNYGIVKNVKQDNLLDYYTPLIQDIGEEKIVPNYETTGRPVYTENRHNYEINDDILGQEEADIEEYALPITTETPIEKFRPPNGASNGQLVPSTSLKYGATRGKPNVDYPAHTSIPKTDFNCKEQRYKGFFGDPSTGCQVWHYCDLNGGKSSFLCPNGTIFSQVALTCDWWFNVKCESTTQLYVLNERLYKYILPIMPKFPEDFSGPEVDRYLELKFKEMEAKLKEKKLKKQQEKDKIKEKLQSLDNDE